MKLHLRVYFLIIAARRFESSRSMTSHNSTRKQTTHVLRIEMPSSGSAPITQVPKSVDVEPMFSIAKPFNLPFYQHPLVGLRERNFPCRIPREDHNGLLLHHQNHRSTYKNKNFRGYLPWRWPEQDRLPATRTASAS